MTRNGRPAPLAPLARRAVVAVLLPAAVLGVTACGTTVIIDTTASTAADVTTSTMQLPFTTPERIAEIVTLATGLGDLIVAGDDAPIIGRIDALWAASSDEVIGQAPELGREIEHQLDVLHTGVQRNRPADADKAARNLATVLAAYLERQPA
jgi:hypothetical protein